MGAEPLVRQDDPTVCLVYTGLSLAGRNFAGSTPVPVIDTDCVVLWSIYCINSVVECPRHMWEVTGSNPVYSTETPVVAVRLGLAWQGGRFRTLLGGWLVHTAGFIAQFKARGNCRVAGNIRCCPGWFPGTVAYFIPLRGWGETQCLTLPSEWCYPGGTT